MNFVNNNEPVIATAVPIINQINEVAAREFLSIYPNSWPKGLQDTFINSIKKFPFRFFICDDSGSV